MTPQEKLDWFWSMGELPGTIFDDLNDGDSEMKEQYRQRRARWPRHGARKRLKKTQRRTTRRASS